MIEIKYELLRSKRKTIALQVTPEGALVVHAPFKTPMGYIAGLVESKRRWIEGKQRLLRQRTEQHLPQEMATGEELPYLGGKLLLVITDKVDTPVVVGETLAIPKKARNAQACVKAWYVAEAARYFTLRVEHFSELAAIPYRSVGVTDARHRWGSCSSRGSINFSWRLILCPTDIIDYVVVHELAHIVHLNHSAAFWQKVLQLMPDFKERRLRLKADGALLNLF